MYSHTCGNLIAGLCYKGHDGDHGGGGEDSQPPADQEAGGVRQDYGGPRAGLPEED